MLKSHNKLLAIAFAKNKKCWFFNLDPQGNFKQDESLAPLPLLCVYLCYFEADTCPALHRQVNHLRRDYCGIFSSFKVKDTEVNDCCKAGVTLGSRSCKGPQNRSFSMRSSSPQNETVPQSRAEPKKWGLLWTPLSTVDATMIEQTHNHEHLFSLCSISHLNIKTRSVPWRWAQHHWSSVSVSLKAVILPRSPLFM